MKHRILFIDDEPRVLETLRRLLWNQRAVWEMDFLDSSLAAWDELQEKQYDVVLSDVRMPGLSGLQLLERIKQTKSMHDILVIMLTGESDRSLKRKALDLEATDLLNKPLDSDELIARLRSALRLKSYQDELKCHNELLERTVQARSEQLYASRVDIIWRLGKAAEFRDEETGNHVVRVGCYSRTVAEKLGMDHAFVDNLFMGAPLHDIGKIGIPDSILLKPGKLNDDERRIMQRHCAIGAEILSNDIKDKWAFGQVDGLHIQQKLPEFENSILRTAASIALFHHEKWDGGGYPHGIRGQEIPLEARIVAIADVYDALRSNRPYKRPFNLEKTLAILGENAGNHFDPEVHAAFLASLGTIRTTEEKLRDGTTDETEVALMIGS